MKKTKLIAAACSAILLTTTPFVLAGCGNMDYFDHHFVLNYAVIEENGHNVLHKVKTWADSERDSVTVTTGDCCNNYIWSSVVKSNLYKEKPPEYAYDFECGHELSQNESGEGIEK